MQLREETLNKMIIGGVAFLLLFLVHAVTSDLTEFTEYIKWTIGGTLLSALFLVPVFRIMVTKKLEIKELITIGLGFILLMIYTIFLSPLGVLIFILQWITIYAFISVLVSLFHRELEEWV